MVFVSVAAGSGVVGGVEVVVVLVGVGWVMSCVAANRVAKNNAVAAVRVMIQRVWVFMGCRVSAACGVPDGTDGGYGVGPFGVVGVGVFVGGLWWFWWAGVGFGGWFACSGGGVGVG